MSYLAEIKSIKEILESHFKDACDFEFTIQDGKLWINNVRPMKRTSTANIKITLDLYIEKILNESEVVDKISLVDILNYSRLNVENIESLLFLGKGLPSGSGSSTGKIAFTSEEILNNLEQDYILCKEEVNPEDVSAIRLSKGIITSRGGLTSHAANVSRGWGIPSVVGIKSLKIDYPRKAAVINNKTIICGDWITIISNLGTLYLGKGDIQPFDWKQDEDLSLFVKILEKAICTQSINQTSIGKSWLIRDYFLHKTPFIIPYSVKKEVPSQENIAFKNPTSKFYNDLMHVLIVLNDSEREGYNFIIQGFRNSLIRQFSQKIGIGKHHQYYRPLLDPMMFIKEYKDSDKNMYKQLIGEEYFNIGKIIPNLVDIYNVKIYFEIKAKDKTELWFLDHTNLKGESLVQNSFQIFSYYIEINEKPIDHNVFPNLYNVLRKREYFWSWYRDNNLSHRQILEFIRDFEHNPNLDSNINYYAHDLELLDNNELTDSGRNLK